MNTQAILHSCFRFIARKWLSLLLLTLPLTLVWQAGSWLIRTHLEENQTLAAELLLNAVVFSLIEIIAINYVHGVTLTAQAAQTTQTAVGNNHLQPSALYRGALGSWPAMIQLTMLKLIMIGIGLMLFIVPGIIIAVRLALAEQHLVLRKANVTESLRASWKLTAPNFYIVLSILGILFLIHLGFEYLSALTPQPIAMLLFPFGIVVALFSTVAAYRIYTLLHTPPAETTG
jgi:hypothetical protein